MQGCNKSRQVGVPAVGSDNSKHVASLSVWKPRWESNPHTHLLQRRRFNHSRTRPYVASMGIEPIQGTYKIPAVRPFGPLAVALAGLEPASPPYEGVPEPTPVYRALRTLPCTRRQGPVGGCLLAILF